MADEIENFYLTPTMKKRSAGQMPIVPKLKWYQQDI